MKTIIKGLTYATIIFALTASCARKTERPPFDLDGDRTSNSFVIPYEEIDGEKVIPVKVNGVTLNMIYDTGCTGVHMSTHEVVTLLKNGRINKEDFRGYVPSTIADGSTIINMQFIIRELQIGDKNGIVLKDVEATVSDNEAAPVLLGNSVLNELASVEVDNIDKEIIFYKR